MQDQRTTEQRVRDEVREFLAARKRLDERSQRALFDRLSQLAPLKTIISALAREIFLQQQVVAAFTGSPNTNAQSPVMKFAPLALTTIGRARDEEGRAEDAVLGA